LFDMAKLRIKRIPSHFWKQDSFLGEVCY